jgi:hypothetical protein
VKPGLRSLAWLFAASVTLLGRPAAAAEPVRAQRVAEGAWFVQGEAALGSAANRNFVSNAAQRRLIASREELAPWIDERTLRAPAPVPRGQPHQRVQHLPADGAAGPVTVSGEHRARSIGAC